MTLALRGAAPDDYDVSHDGEIVGRIYRMKADRELWRRMCPGLRGPTDGPSGAAADSLDEAKAAFRAAWERPLSSEKADEKCSAGVRLLMTPCGHLAINRVV